MLDARLQSHEPLHIDSSGGSIVRVRGCALLTSEPPARLCRFSSACYRCGRHLNFRSHFRGLVHVDIVSEYAAKSNVVDIIIKIPRGAEQSAMLPSMRVSLGGAGLLVACFQSGVLCDTRRMIYLEILAQRDLPMLPWRCTVRILNSHLNPLDYLSLLPVLYACD
jgi:hypothetical protein